MVVDTIGWTITQWKEFVTSSDSSTVLNTLTSLVSSFSKDDPAWITIATPKQIESQWSDLQKLGSDAKSVCIF